MRRLLLCLFALTWPAAVVCQTIVATDPDSTVDAYFTLRFDSLRLRPPKVASITSLAVAPKVATLQAGLTQAFSATASWSDGKPHPLTVTWSATGGTISSVGLYTAGASAGTYRVVAFASGKADTARVTVTAAPPPPPPPDTTPPPPAATCTPTVTTNVQWQAAISAGTGGTFWVQGNYPGESYIKSTNRVFRACGRATLGNVYIQGAGNTLWGLQVVAKGTGKLGINVRAPNTKLINNVVEQADMSGIGMWTEAPNSEATGNIACGNGTHPNLDHGFYIQNRTGTKLLRDNIACGNAAYGFHLYASNSQPNEDIIGITLQGNIGFDNRKKTTWNVEDFMVGGERSADKITFTENLSYRADRSGTADLGWHGAAGKDFTYRDNYWVGGVKLGSWASVTQSGNTTVGSTKPSANKIVVRPNLYEPGRANVAIYNWQGLPAVTISVPGLAPGQGYTVQKAADFFGAPVAAGTYAGAITIPMAGEFAAFVVLPR